MLTRLADIPFKTGRGLKAKDLVLLDEMLKVNPRLKELNLCCETEEMKKTNKH